MGSRTFDLIYAAGVLGYLESDAARLVSILLRRTNKILALAGLACTTRNNNRLDRSETSPNHDNLQWIHNFEAMVSAAGGRVARSRWEGARLYNLQTVCFVFAVPN